MPTKEFILSLNDAKPVNERFVIEDLDDTRLFVQAKVAEWLEEQLAAWQEQNTYQVHPSCCNEVTVSCTQCYCHDTVFAG